MEEGAHVMHQVGNSLIPDKIRRTLKTPAQVEALEKFYNEHKYPKEPMKMQFAKKIGLSEKQVSVWLCHRRSKDRRLMQGEVCGHGKQNISSGHASGFGQESCSSTKQVDKHFDPREVESKRSCDHNSSSIVLALEPSGQQTDGRHGNTADDVASGSSSTSHDRTLKHNEDNCFMEYSRFSPLNDRDVNKRRDTFDSRYSCFGVLNERSSISCVKRKLGAQYREDGPPLGVEFDPLPPGAFDSPLEDLKMEHYRLENFVNRNLCGIPTCFGKLKVYDNNRGGLLSSGLFEDQPLKRRIKGFYHQSDLPKCETNQNSKMYKTVENVTNEMPVYNEWRGQRCFTQRSKVGQSRDFLMSGQKADSNMLYHVHCQDDYSSLVSRGEALRGAKLLSQEHERTYFVDVDDSMLCRQLMKKEKIGKEKIMGNDSSSLRPKIPRINDMKFTNKTKYGGILLKHDGQDHSEKHLPSKKLISRYDYDIANNFN